MSSNALPLKKRITKEVIKELIPIAEDCVFSYLNETTKPNPDQIEAAFLSGISAFLSTLRNGGHQDDAYRAAITTSKSLPHAVEAANIVADKVRSPVKKLNKTLNTTTSLIKRAGLSTLTGFPDGIKNEIGRDIESVLRLFTILPKESSTKGSGLFGSGVNNFVNHYNTEWLVPTDTDSTYGGSWFSNLLPWNWNLGGLSSDTGSDDLNTGFDLVEDTPLFTNSTNSTPKTDWSWLSSVPQYLTNTFSSNTTNTSDTTPIFGPENQPNSTNFTPKTDWSWLSNLTNVFSSNSTNATDTTPKTGSELVVKEPPGKIEYQRKETEWKPSVTADDLKGVVTDAANKGFLKTAFNAITGNPILASMVMQATPYIFKYGFPLLGSVASGIGNATLGTAREYFKSNDWSDKPTDSWVTKNIGHRFARGYKGLAQWNDKRFIEPVKKWWNDYGVQKQVSNLGTTIETLLPAFGTDYLRYAQQMQQYKAQQAIAKQKHDWEEQERKEDIARQNANLLYQNKRERQEALSYNSDLMAEYDNELAYADDLRKYNAKVAQTKRDYIQGLKD